MKKRNTWYPFKHLLQKFNAWIEKEDTKAAIKDDCTHPLHRHYDSEEDIIKLIKK